MAQIDVGKLSFSHKGNYDASTAYVLNDIVYYNGSAYVAKTSTTGNLPTSTARWNLFVLKEQTHPSLNNSRRCPLS